MKQKLFNQTAEFQLGEFVEFKYSPRAENFSEGYIINVEMVTPEVFSQQAMADKELYYYEKFTSGLGWSEEGWTDNDFFSKPHYDILYKKDGFYTSDLGISQKNIRRPQNPKPSLLKYEPKFKIGDFVSGASPNDDIYDSCIVAIGYIPLDIYNEAKKVRASMSSREYHDRRIFTDFIDSKPGVNYMLLGYHPGGYTDQSHLVQDDDIKNYVEEDFKVNFVDIQTMECQAAKIVEED